MVWDNIGMSRSETGLNDVLKKIPELREEFWSDVRVTGTGEHLNAELEKAGRVAADFLELGELMAQDALTRTESCGGHFREESKTEEDEAKRDDKFCFVSAWEYTGTGKKAKLHKEKLTFENVELTQRSYK